MIASKPVNFVTSPNKLVGASDTYSYQSSTSPGTCQSLPTLTPLQAETMVCSQAVTYPFFVPTGVTLAQLNAAAISKLNATGFGILPPTCQAAFINYVCSLTYRKCVFGADLTLQSTWNADIYGSVSQIFPLPFQRPCVSVCNTITTTCLGLPTLFGQATPSCTSRFDYSNGKLPLPTSQQPYQFDQNAGNNPVVCNPMNPISSISVASSSEAYAGAVQPNAGKQVRLGLVPASQHHSGSHRPTSFPMGFSHPCKGQESCKALSRRS